MFSDRCVDEIQYPSVADSVSYAIQEYTGTGSFTEFTLAFWFRYDVWPANDNECVMGYSTGVPAGHLTTEDLNDESLDVWFVKSENKLRIHYAKDNKICKLRI